MTLADRIARLIDSNPRLHGVPTPIIEEVTRQALGAMLNLSFPAGVTLTDALDGEWESCESCSEMLAAENMCSDDDGVPLCKPCLDGMIADAAAQAGG